MRATAMAMVIGLCFVFASVGCGEVQKMEGDVKKEAGGSLGDDALKAAVTAELVKADKADAAKIQVDAKSGVVTLSGSGDKAAAEKVAKGVPGVTKVVNNIK
jgi:osmotically-inducible protein OsmY